MCFDFVELLADVGRRGVLPQKVTYSSFFDAEYSKVRGIELAPEVEPLCSGIRSGHGVGDVDHEALT
jgi:hypothetical protein